MSRASLLAALLALSARAWAGPTGAVDPHAAPATGFPGAYATTVSLSLAADPFYGSRFLDAFQINLKSVCSMTAPRAAAAYLEQTATAGQGLSDLRAKLGREALPPPQASALLIANVLAKPDQARELLDRLESLRAGLGRHAADILRRVDGAGDPGLIAALKAAGEREPQGDALTYGRDGRLATLFDGSPAGGLASAAAPVDASDYRPPARRAGLLLPPRQ